MTVAQHLAAAEFHLSEARKLSESSQESAGPPSLTDEIIFVVSEAFHLAPTIIRGAGRSEGASKARMTAACAMIASGQFHSMSHIDQAVKRSYGTAHHARARFRDVVRNPDTDRLWNEQIWTVWARLHEIGILDTSDPKAL